VVVGVVIGLVGLVGLVGRLLGLVGLKVGLFVVLDCSIGIVIGDTVVLLLRNGGQNGPEVTTPKFIPICCSIPVGRGGVDICC
jgi:hypothetical protein